jgi:hypothetical protein
MNLARVIRGIALCIVLLLASGHSGWSQEQKDKEQAGGQAGTSSKDPDPKGSHGGHVSPVRTCDSDSTAKKKVVKKAKKKPEPTKSASNY